MKGPSHPCADLQTLAGPTVEWLVWHTYWIWLTWPIHGHSAGIQGLYFQLYICGLSSLTWPGPGEILPILSLLTTFLASINLTLWRLSYMHMPKHLVLDNLIICLSYLALVPCLFCCPSYPLGGVLPLGVCFSNTNQPIQSPHPQPPPFLGSHTPDWFTPPQLPQAQVPDNQGHTPVLQSLL